MIGEQFQTRHNRIVSDVKDRFDAQEATMTVCQVWRNDDGQWRGFAQGVRENMIFDYELSGSTDVYLGVWSLSVSVIHNETFAVLRNAERFTAS